MMFAVRQVSVEYGLQKDNTVCRLPMLESRADSVKVNPDDLWGIMGSVAIVVFV